MVRKVLALIFLGMSVLAMGQTRPGSLRGKVTDAQNGETVPFANVTVKQGNTIITGSTTDLDGEYNINPVPAGTYDVEVSFLGYQTSTIRKVVVSPDRPTLLNFKLATESAQLAEVVITWEAPLIDGTKTSSVTSAEDIVNMAVRDITSVAATTAGVFQSDEGQATFVRGAREGTTTYFVDGVKVRGSTSLPQAAIAQTEVITGGLPAQYGDATGGVISTTTRGPSPVYFGSAEYLTSSLFDDYNYNLLALTGGGPLYKKNGQTVIGFLLAGEFEFQDDPRPYATPVYKVKDDIFADLQANPVRPAVVGQGVNNRAEFITRNDLETLQAKQNAERQEARVSGNVQFKTSTNTNLTLGGRFVYAWGKNAGFFNHLFNYDNNLEFRSTDWSAFARFQQKFGTTNIDPNTGKPEEDNGLIKNAFYTIQVDYTRNNRLTQDALLQDNYFAYGHLGRFQVYQTRFYNFGTDTVTGLTGWQHILYQDTAVTFAPGPYNQVRSNYTTQYFNLVNSGSVVGNAFNYNNIRQGNGLLNGDNPDAVYNGLWGNIGAAQGGFNKSQASQFRVTGSSTFDIKDHSFIVGFEYEQRIDRAFGLGAVGLWNQMRLLQNDHIRELDFANPMPVYDQFGVFQDTINYERLIDLSRPRTFDRNVRTALGLDPNGRDWLDIDSYDPEFFSLDMFSADELLNIGATQYVSYYGYDYKGNLQSGNPTLEDFFTKRDENGNLTREVPAFQPIYIAGYIQDQFTFDDLFFNVGVRVDRYDANQPVLKDPYLLYPARTVGDLGGTALANEAIPSNIGSDYVVYVDNMNNPNAIVGYRSGNTWYNAAGQVEVNPRKIADLSGGIQPFLFEPGNQQVGAESFIDYTPQVNVMPRVSFNFPISDQALFLAHYDVLVQRPDGGLSRLDPISFLQLQSQNNSGIFNNPNLLPQRTTDYELGFQQALTQRSSLTISAFYREMRDMLQTVSLVEAYPITYVTYGNQDFGTVKGFSINYDLRRTNNVSLVANYTLQFANGSGSSANSGANLARSGQPNLRYILPLDYDSRHQLTARLDFRYGSGSNYNGPTWWNKQVFANAGINLTFNANSGTPFSRRQFAYPLTSGASAVPLTGQINGSRLPWQFRVDMRINKVFDIVYGKNKDKSTTLEVYVQVLNLLDTRNILNVYPFSGSAEDDGYLTSAQAQSSIASQVSAQSYVDLYNVAMVNPFNFTLPRRVRLGLVLSF